MVLLDFTSYLVDFNVQWKTLIDGKSTIQNLWLEISSDNASIFDFLFLSYERPSAVHFWKQSIVVCKCPYELLMITLILVIFCW